ncbi:MAG TPA: bifunctional hydroxymethylpyrimidine kinase/phosphomethylpyrimidine kinase, partial [Verrucomicrobiae bacterium]|nr:bifunctional hydroxymethylpyrimidine kinase/phosphomethylpyrimidine kinase [Verrucomicrobiae bacterium]
CSPQMLQRQLEAVFAELKPRAAKTGMLLTAKNISLIAGFFRRLARSGKPPLIVDPVLVSTSGTRLLEPRALKILMEKLLPAATLVTPNLSEAEILTAQKIDSLATMREAARTIHSRWGCAVLVKGGHLRDAAQATDLFFDGQQEITLSSPFVKGVRTHGTGCVYSAAICAGLALGKDLPSAVRAGKKFVTQAISRSYRIGPRGRHFVLQLP